MKPLTGLFLDDERFPEQVNYPDGIEWIRCNEGIDLYIPSSRMRELFKRWLNDEFIEVVV